MQRALLGLVAGLTALSCQDNPQPAETVVVTEEIQFRIDGTLDIIRMGGETLLTLDIEIADTDSLRERGMMQRTSFPSDTGMLFLFDQETVQQFWMGNTPLSLDLVFIAADSQIVDVAKYATPYSDDPIISRVPAQFVLEVPAGFVDSRGLVEGDRVRWARHEQP